jgi:glycosyltransferase involved in cell wall biosynthesis
MRPTARALYRTALALNWALALAWTARTLYWLHGWRRVPDLLAAPAPDPEPPLPSISVIVPARNEEAAVGSCLTSLLGSTGVRLEVLAVDDRSTDRTGAIMDAAAGRGASRGKNLRVLHLRNLPAGWMGKTHAMARAAAEAHGDWLLFADADVLFRPDTLARTLRFAEEKSAAHVVLLPTAITHTPGERMVMGFFLAASIWGPPVWKVPDPDAPRAAVGIGAFNLVRREAYRAVGGWEAIRLEVIEDLALGYLLKRGGFLSYAVTGRGLLRIRWVTGARSLVRDLGKNAFAAFRYRPALAMLALLGGSALLIFPFAALLGPRALRIPSALTLASLSALYLRHRRDSGAGAAYVPTFPLAAGLLLFALARSTAITLRDGGVTWRGTFYPLHLLRSNMARLR